MTEFDLATTLQLFLSGGLTTLVLGTLVYLQVAALRKNLLPKLDKLGVPALALVLSMLETGLAFALGKLDGSLPSYGWSGILAFGLLTGLVAVGLATAQKEAILKALPLLQSLLLEVLNRYANLKK